MSVLDMALLSLILTVANINTRILKNMMLEIPLVSGLRTSRKDP